MTLTAIGEKKLHKVLRRLLAKSNLEADPPMTREVWDEVLARRSPTSWRQIRSDLLERSMQISSEEMTERWERIRDLLEKHGFSTTSCLIRTRSFAKYRAMRPTRRFSRNCSKTWFALMPDLARQSCRPLWQVLSLVASCGLSAERVASRNGILIADGVGTCGRGLSRAAAFLTDVERSNWRERWQVARTGAFRLVDSVRREHGRRARLFPVYFNPPARPRKACSGTS